MFSLDLDFFPSRIQGLKKHRIPDPQHCFFLPQKSYQTLQIILSKRIPVPYSRYKKKNQLTRKKKNKSIKLDTCVRNSAKSPKGKNVSQDMLTKRSRRACLFQSLLIFSTYSKMLRGILSHVFILNTAFSQI
jgi:hypothetical protein